MERNSHEQPNNEIKRKEALAFLFDYKQQLRGGFERNPKTPEEELAFWQLFDTGWLKYPMPTPEELYSDTERFGKDTLQMLLDGVPDKMADLSQIVSQINVAIKAKNLHEYKKLINKAMFIIEPNEQKSEGE